MREVTGHHAVSIAAADTPARPQQKKLELIIGDFVKADLPYFDVCISNTPYQVSGRRRFASLYCHRGGGPIIHPLDLQSLRPVDW
jgi:hypothetical protein